MPTISDIANMPDVAAIVLTDDTGALLDYKGVVVDPEMCGGVHLVATQMLAQCGNALGMGLLHKTAVIGRKHAWLILTFKQQVLGIHIDPAKPMSTFEKRLENASVSRKR